MINSIIRAAVEEKEIIDDINTFKNKMSTDFNETDKT